MSDRGCAFAILVVLLVGVVARVSICIVVSVQLASDVVVTLREVGTATGAKYGRAFEMMNLLIECAFWVYRRFMRLFLWWA